MSTIEDIEYLIEQHAEGLLGEGGVDPDAVTDLALDIKDAIDKAGERAVTNERKLYMYFLTTKGTFSIISQDTMETNSPRVIVEELSRPDIDVWVYEVGPLVSSPDFHAKHFPGVQSNEEILAKLSTDLYSERGTSQRGADAPQHKPQ